MSANQSNSPDTAEWLTLLGQAAELCRTLGLPKDAAIFDTFIARFRKQPPTYEILKEEVSGSLDGLTGARIIAKLEDYSEYNRLQMALGRLIFPESLRPGRKKSRQKHKAVRGSENFWQLDGGSDLNATTVPDPAKPGSATTVRLTLSNSYGPIDDAELSVRIGDPKNPTQQDDLDSASDWVPAHLVEELVSVDGEEMLRSKAQEPFDDETPWEATFDAQLRIAPGERSIEIKIIGRTPEVLRSLVLTGWNISVG
jgi:hypothetical protein